MTSKQRDICNKGTPMAGPDYRLLFDRSPDGIVAVNQRGEIVFANEAAAAGLGYTLEEFLSLRITDFEAKETRKEFERHYADMLRGERLRFETLHRRKDGSLMGVEVVLSLTEQDGEVIGYSFWRDITERKRMQADLLLFNEVVAAMAEGVALTRTADGTIVYANPTFERMFGYARGELEGRNVSVLNAPGDESPETIAARIQAQLASTGVWMGIIGNVKKDGTPFWCSVSVTTLDHHRYGKVWVGVHQDITARVLAEEELKSLNRDLEERMRIRAVELETANRALTAALEKRKKADAAMRESEQRFRSLFETMKDGITVAGTDGRIVMMNPSMRAMLGFSEEEVRGMTMAAIHPEDALPQVRREFEAHARRERYSSADIPVKRKDGTVFYADVATAWLTIDGVPHMGGIFHDVMERRKHIQQLTDALQQKEVLLREVYHRVKNNLQVVASMLYLQSGKIGDPEMLRIFLESRDRVMAISLVHDQLYRNDDLSKVDFSEYLHRLVSSLSQTYKTAGRSIEIRVDAKEIPYLTLDQTVPCGLIVNELISNAMKHAFPGNRPGRITVGAQLSDPGVLELFVADDGIGIADGLSGSDTGTLGMQLVRSLAQQIDGTIGMNNERGARISVRFPAMAAEQTT